MKNQMHLKDVPEDDPKPTENSDITANCGAVIPKAVFAFQWIEGEPLELPRSTLLICSECFMISRLTVSEGKRRVFGLYPGDRPNKFSKESDL